MSDLISRQALLNELEHDLACFETENKSEKEMYIAVSDMRRMIEGQKTAYDVQGVIDKLIMENVHIEFYTDDGWDKCVEIIKAGGVHE